MKNHALVSVLLFALGTMATGLAAAPAPSPRSTDDDPFESSFFTGLGIDTFAGSDLQKYLNPEDSGNKRERYVAGIDFSYRLIGKPGKQQLWIYGETVHGLRSEEVDCESNPDIPVCKDFSSVIAAGEKTIYLLRNSSSLEAFAGLKYGFATAQRGTTSPAMVYLKAQAGFLTISRGSGDVVDMHHAGLGLEAVGGSYEHSYFELGFGRTDLFLIHPRDRWKLDGFLTWKMRGTLFKHAAPFVQIVVDVDGGHGADSIQSYIGFDVSLGQLFLPGSK
jgi:hypothetical protein